MLVDIMLVHFYMRSEGVSVSTFIVKKKFFRLVDFESARV